MMRVDSTGGGIRLSRNKSRTNFCGTFLLELSARSRNVYRRTACSGPHHGLDPQGRLHSPNYSHRFRGGINTAKVMVGNFGCDYWVLGIGPRTNSKGVSLWNIQEAVRGQIFCSRWTYVATPFGLKNQPGVS